MTIITRKHVSRRTILRGLGASLALPFLDSMVPALAARQTATKPVARLGIVYVPMGMNMAAWTPTTEGRDFDLSPILQPLAGFREEMLVVSGLDNREAELRAQDGGGVHSRCVATWATAVRAKKTAGADFQLGISMDQIAANELGNQTRLKSLELTLESGDVVGQCDYGYTCAYSSTIAWSGPSTPLPPEVIPRVVFERLFGEPELTDPGARQARLQTQASLLDSLADEVARFQAGLGPRDRTKLSEYLESVREIERRIQKTEEQSSRELPVGVQPPGVPETLKEHSELMFDLLALAYQSDVTRVATFMIGRELSNRTHPEIGISEPHHPLSHHSNDPDKLAKQAKLNAYHAELFKHFVERLRATPDGDGSLLDHTILLYGSSMSDSNSHIPLGLPTMVVGGRAMGLKGGRHVRYPSGTPLSNLQVAVLDKLGVYVDKFGDSSEKLNLLSDI